MKDEIQCDICCTFGCIHQEEKSAVFSGLDVTAAWKSS